MSAGSIGRACSARRMFRKNGLERLAVAFELRLADAVDAEHGGWRIRAQAHVFLARGVVEGHLGRYAGLVRQSQPTCALRIPERFVGGGDVEAVVAVFGRLDAHPRLLAQRLRLFAVRRASTPSAETLGFRAYAAPSATADRRHRRRCRKWTGARVDVLAAQHVEAMSGAYHAGHRLLHGDGAVSGFGGDRQMSQLPQMGAGVRSGGQALGAAGRGSAPQACSGLDSPAGSRVPHGDAQCASSMADRAISARSSKRGFPSCNRRSGARNSRYRSPRVGTRMMSACSAQASVELRKADCTPHFDQASPPASPSRRSGARRPRQRPVAPAPESGSSATCRLRASALGSRGPAARRLRPPPGRYSS